MTSKPVDAALKRLVSYSPLDWARLAGLTADAVTVIDADVSTVSAAADKVLRVARRGRPDLLCHLEFVAGHDAPAVVRRLPLYNTSLDHHFECPVRSVLVVLHVGADSPQLSGEWARGIPGEDPHLVFRYHILRPWRIPAEQFLAGGLGMLPLAPIAEAEESRLPEIVVSGGARPSRP